MSNLDNYWQSDHEAILLETRVILNEYLLSIKLANKAEATIRKYRWILERFFSECTKSLNKLTSNDVLSWLNEFSVGKKPKTIDLFLSALSSFFQFCLMEEYMENIVIKKRWRPKIPRALPKYLNEQEYARVKMVAESLSLRDRSLILFLFSTGCRSSEASQLNIQDIQLDKSTAIVMGKGKKIRHIHFSEECALVLKEYLETRFGEQEGPLFKNKFGERQVTASATATSNVVTVNFSKAVTNSALTPANYAVNGKVLPSDTVITKNSDTQVSFTLPVGTVAKSDSEAVFTVNNVKAQDSSATFKNYVGVIVVLDNTRPVGTGSILANGLGKITFSEAIASGLTAGDIKTDLPTVKVNGLVLDASTITYTTATELDGTDAITLSVSALIADGDQAKSEYDYLYIDVDGDSAFDLTKDIVLERSASEKAAVTVANGGWNGITTADLNKVNSVEVIAHTTVVSIKDKSTLANTLAPKASIKF